MVGNTISVDSDARLQSILKKLAKSYFLYSHLAIHFIKILSSYLGTLQQFS